MITKAWPGWYKVNKDFYYPLEQVEWCRKNLGDSDYYTWVYQKELNRPGHFSFKEEKWAMMFVLRWS